MTILQSLNGYYKRMAERGEAEAPGFSREKIGFAVVLSPEGAVTGVIDLRTASGKKMQPVLREVPAAVKRTAGILPNRLWDKTSYTLGRTGGEGRRTTEEHAAFKALHRTILAGTEDVGLLALARFLETWDAQAFDAPPFTPEMLDANVVFRLDGEMGLIHERPAARLLVEAAATAGVATEVCLVTGQPTVAHRLHPTIKGVEGAQSSGAALVSFNLDAFESYGKEQGANAPTSEAAAFRYGAALNRMLDRGSRNRLRRPIGDATVVFWADTSDAVSETAAAAAEDFFGTRIDPPAATDAAEAAKLRDDLEQVAEGRPLAKIDPKLVPGTRFHVLGLSPNAARLSVRYWLSDEFETFAKRLANHHADLAIEPRPLRWTTPSVNLLLVKTVALQEDFKNIPPLLAGEVMRAVLEGTRYPRSWLAGIVMRLRAGDDPSTGWHAAAIRACLQRDHRLHLASKPKRVEAAPDDPAPVGDAGARHDFERTPVPMSLDKNDGSEAYQLGRLFAALETAQRLALGRVNATIRDRYFGAASATPAGVFPLLLRGAQNHIGKLRKERKDGWIEREIGEIVDRLPPALPRSLKLEAQGRFAIGYYHQRQAQFAKRPALAAEEATTPEGINEDTQDDG